MNEQALPDAAMRETVARIEELVRCRLTGLLRDFRLVVRDNGLVLRGHVHTYYAKQLAQHAVMKARAYASGPTWLPGVERPVLDSHAAVLLIRVGSGRGKKIGGELLTVTSVGRWTRSSQIVTWPSWMDRLTLPIALELQRRGPGQLSQGIPERVPQHAAVEAADSSGPPRDCRLGDSVTASGSFSALGPACWCPHAPYLHGTLSISSVIGDNQGHRGGCNRERRSTHS
jgi:hypothetical protein